MPQAPLPSGGTGETEMGSPTSSVLKKNLEYLFNQLVFQDSSLQQHKIKDWRTMALGSGLVIQGRNCFSDGKTHFKFYHQNTALKVTMHPYCKRNI